MKEENLGRRPLNNITHHHSFTYMGALFDLSSRDTIQLLAKHSIGHEKVKYFRLNITHGFVQIVL